MLSVIAAVVEMGSVKGHMKPVLCGTRGCSETVESVGPGLQAGEPGN
jgi:hypothetical protein